MSKALDIGTGRSLLQICESAHLGFFRQKLLEFNPNHGFLATGEVTALAILSHDKCDQGTVAIPLLIAWLYTKLLAHQIPVATIDNFAAIGPDWFTQPLCLDMEKQ